MNASVVVRFGADTDPEDAASAHLSAEIDKREDGPNGGKTSFAPGDTVHFLVFKSERVLLDSPASSAGAVALGGSVNVERQEDITFANSATANLSVPPAGGSIDAEWIGNDLGPITFDGTTAKVAKKGLGVAKVKYTAAATTGHLDSPESIKGYTEFSIIVLIVGNITGT